MKQILCFGDSNTYGLVPATTDRYGWGVRWTSIINEKLGLQEYRVIGKDFAAGQRYLTTRSAKADGEHSCFRHCLKPIVCWTAL